MNTEIQASKTLGYWALIPAAGIGSRMGIKTPKQFLDLGGQMMIERVVGTFASHPRIDGVVVGLSPNSDTAEAAKAIESKVFGIFEGGDTRASTVLNGLQHLIERDVSQADWVLVHDSNRPFLRHEDIDFLLDSVEDDQNGAVMCAPVYDTVKQSDRGRIEKTLPRGNIFRAQTPQMFKVGILKQALRKSEQSGIQVSDESQAIEVIGMSPKIVIGPPRNIKITTADDWLIAKALLSAG